MLHLNVIICFWSLPHPSKMLREDLFSTPRAALMRDIVLIGLVTSYVETAF